MAITETGPVVPGRWWSLGQVFILLLSISAFFGVAAAVDETYQQILMLLGLPVAALMAWLFMRKDGGTGIGLKRPESWPKTIGMGLACGVGLLLILRFVLIPMITPWLGSWWDPAQFDADKGDVGKWAVYVFFVSWFHAAFCEEVIFRGFFFQRFEKAFTGTKIAVGAAILLQGVLFGLAHLGNGKAAFVATGLAGVLFGVMFVLFRRNLWANIVAHALVDTTIFTLVFFGEHRFLLPD